MGITGTICQFGRLERWYTTKRTENKIQKIAIFEKQQEPISQQAPGTTVSGKQ
jgi:hypothetical protein